MRVQGDPVPANNGVFYLLGDHLGSTSLVADPSGNLLSELRYKGWGETRYSSGPTPTDYRYTGQRQEAGIGLYYYRARWYDPELGRFAQADTIVVGSNPGSWDRYAYIFNNPARHVDPTGHVCSDPEDPNQWCTSTGGPSGGGSTGGNGGSSRGGSSGGNGAGPSGGTKSSTPKAKLGGEVLWRFSPTEDYRRWPGNTRFYGSVATGLDALQVLLDLYALGVVHVWTWAGGIAGTPGGPFTVPVSGLSGWGWGQLEAQPLLRASDAFGWLSLVPTVVSSAKSGETFLQVTVARTTSGQITVQNDVVLAPSVANSYIGTVAGSSPLGMFAETSLAMDALALWQDLAPSAAFPVHEQIVWRSTYELPMIP